METSGAVQATASIAIPNGNNPRGLPEDFLASPTSSPYTSPATSPVSSSSGSFSGPSSFPMSPPSQQLLMSKPLPGLSVGHHPQFDTAADEGLVELYPCLVCTQRFPTHQPLLEHMGLFHHLVIADLHQIADLPA